MNTAAKYIKLIDNRDSPEELKKLVRGMRPEDIQSMILKLEPEFRRQRPSVIDRVFQVLVESSNKDTLDQSLILMIQGIGDPASPT